MPKRYETTVPGSSRVPLTVPSRYLLRLAELELIDRERRMVERRIKAAKFPAPSR
jgi:hypothetical protein